MLFTEAQLKSANPMAVLDEAVYLDESEALINPTTVPIREMSRLGEGVTMVRFDDIAALAESHGADYIDAMVAVAEASGVDPELMAVAVDEADIITDPDIVLELANVVVAPLSEDSLAMRYVCECVDLWSQMEDNEESDMALAEALIDDTYLQTFLDEAGASAQDAVFGPGLVATDDDPTTAGVAIRAGKTTGNFLDDLRMAGKTPGAKDKGRTAYHAIKNYVKANPKKSAAVAGGALVGTAAILAGVRALIKKKNAPKSWLGQKVAALRKIYHSWMQKAAKGGSGVSAKLKQAAGKLLQIIDALMAKLQRMAG